MLLSPGDDVANMPKDEFSELLRKEEVFDSVANEIFETHDDRNKKMNDKNPLMIPMGTTV